MSKSQVGWIKVLGAGAAGAVGVLGAAPISVTTAVIAALTFLVGSAGAATALYHESPTERTGVNGGAKGQAVDDEDPK